jgi:hypothetical protein
MIRPSVSQQASAGTRHHRTGARAAVLLAFALCATSAGAGGDPDPAGARVATPAIPANYLRGFVEYTRWPAEDAIERWRLCTPGAAAPLWSRYQGITVRGRTFEVLHIANGDDGNSCQLLDLTTLDVAAAAPLLERFHGRPVLLIGIGEDFCSAGGHVCLATGPGPGDFRINLSAAHASGLTINSKLLLIGRKRTSRDDGEH